MSKEDEATAEFSRREEAAHRLAHPNVWERLLSAIPVLVGIALVVFFLVCIGGGLNG